MMEAILTTILWTGISLIGVWTVVMVIRLGVFDVVVAIGVLVWLACTWAMASVLHATRRIPHPKPR